MPEELWMEVRDTIQETGISKPYIDHGNFLQWLGLGTFTAVGPGLIPGPGTKIRSITWPQEKNKNKKTSKQKTPLYIDHERPPQPF